MGAIVVALRAMECCWDDTKLDIAVCDCVCSALLVSLDGLDAASGANGVIPAGGCDDGATCGVTRGTSCAAETGALGIVCAWPAGG